MKTLQEFILEANSGATGTTVVVFLQGLKGATNPAKIVTPNAGTEHNNDLGPFSSKYYLTQWEDAGITDLVVKGKMNARMKKFIAKVEKKSTIKVTIK